MTRRKDGKGLSQIIQEMSFSVSPKLETLPQALELLKFADALFQVIIEEELLDNDKYSEHGQMLFYIETGNWRLGFAKFKKEWKRLHTESKQKLEVLEKESSI